MLIDNNDINYTKILLSIHILISLFSSLLILYCRHYLHGAGQGGGDQGGAGHHGEKYLLLEPFGIVGVCR